MWSALKRIDATDYESWRNIGFILRDINAWQNGLGRALFDAWSEKNDKKKRATQDPCAWAHGQETLWNSTSNRAEDERLHLGSLFQKAYDAGWNGRIGDLPEEFQQYLPPPPPPSETGSDDEPTPEKSTRPISATPGSWSSCTAKTSAMSPNGSNG